MPPALRPQPMSPPGCPLSVLHIFIRSVRGVEKAVEAVTSDHSNGRTETPHASRSAGPTSRSRSSPASGFFALSQNSAARHLTASSSDSRSQAIGSVKCC